MTWIAIAALCTLLSADLPYAGAWKLQGAAKTIELTPRGSDGLTVAIKLVTDVAFNIAASSIMLIEL